MNPLLNFASDRLKTLPIREFNYSTTNGSFVWPNSAELAKFIMDHITSFKQKRILELGSGTGMNLN